MDEIITLDYGSGGKKTARLIEKLIVPALSNPALDALGDGAIVEGAEKLTFSTDSFVVDPLFFPGGDMVALEIQNDQAVRADHAAVRHALQKYLLAGKRWIVLRRIVQYGEFEFPDDLWCSADKPTNL